MKIFLDKLFGKPNQVGKAPQAMVGEKIDNINSPDASPEVKPGDLLRQDYEVRKVLGFGGCGIVYLVYSRSTKSVFALKTFRDEFLQDKSIRERFRQEAAVWINLERHPYLVRAHFVENIEGRLFVGMDYIAPNDLGINCLSDYIANGPLSLEQSLRWAIQFCYGMQHAYLKGIRCHRDIKPANIMIDKNGVLKISDFGLAGVLHAPTVAGSTQEKPLSAGSSTFKTMQGMGFGTPTHMPPEQFVDAARCDQRSDIYSFGVVLYQMQGSGHLPFLAPEPRDNTRAEQMRFWQGMFLLHAKSPTPSINSPLNRIVQRCLEKAPSARYQTFDNLRVDLEKCLLDRTGKKFLPPRVGEYDAWEWNNKGGSLHALGDHEQALACYEKALKIAPWFVEVWANKSLLLKELERLPEAMDCIDKALLHDPGYAHGLSIKGNLLNRMHKFDQAIECFDKALSNDGQLFEAWSNKGTALMSLARFDEALACFDKSLLLYRKGATAWHWKAVCLQALGDPKTAVACCDTALGINPDDAVVLSTKATSLTMLGNYEDAYSSIKQALSIDKVNPTVWFAKAGIESALGQGEASLNSYRQFLALSITEDPEQIEFAKSRIRELDEPASIKLIKDKVAKAAAVSFGKVPHTRALSELADAYKSLKQYDKAIQTYKETIAILEEKWGSNGLVMVTAPTLNSLALLYHNLGNPQEAKTLYERAIKMIEGDESYGPEDRNLTYFLVNLAAVQIDLGFTGEAQSLCKRAVAILENVLGANAIELISPLKHYANALRKDGRNAEAAVIDARIRQLRNVAR